MGEGGEGKESSISPGGSTSAQSSPKRSVVRGVVGAGFMTTVFPARSAGATFIISRITGKFQGVIAATTPSGVCCRTIFCPSSSLITCNGRSSDEK